MFKKATFISCFLFLFLFMATCANALEIIPPSIVVDGKVLLGREIYERIVYGLPQDVPGNDWKEVNGIGYPRYLGYTVNGDPYTFDEFPDDAFTGDMEDWDMINNPWREGLCFPNDRDAISNEVWEAIYVQLQQKGFPEKFCDRAYIKVLSIPSEGIKGSVRVWHWVDGIAWYKTFTNIADKVPGQEEEPTPVTTEPEPEPEPEDNPTTGNLEDGLTIEPSYQETYVGGQVQFHSYVVKDGKKGNDVTNNSVWSVSDKDENGNDIALVKGKGLIQGNALGTANITAQYNGKKDTAKLEIVRKDDNKTYKAKYFIVYLIPREGSFSYQGQTRQYYIKVALLEGDPDYFDPGKATAINDVTNKIGLIIEDVVQHVSGKEKQTQGKEIPLTNADAANVIQIKDGLISIPNDAPGGYYTAALNIEKGFWLSTGGALSTGDISLTPKSSSNNDQGEVWEHIENLSLPLDINLGGKTKLGSFEVVPEEMTIEVGQAGQFHGILKTQNSAGTEISQDVTNTTDWAKQGANSQYDENKDNPLYSSYQHIVPGRVIGVTPGVDIVTGSLYDDFRSSHQDLIGKDTAKLTVAGGPVPKELWLVPDILGLTPYEKGEFRAWCLFADDTVKDVTEDLGCDWLSTDPETATVNNTTHKGQVTGKKQGETVISATYGGLTATGKVTVSNLINLAIGNFAITPNPADPGSEITVSGIAYSNASQPVTTTVQFGMDGRIINVTEITIPAKGSIPVSFTFASPSPGSYATEIYVNPQHVVTESTYDDNYMDGTLRINEPYRVPASSGPGSLTFQAVSQYGDWRDPGTARWTDDVTATLAPPEPVPPQGWITSWQITSASLTYPQRHPEFSFSHPVIPEDTTTINMQPEGHTAMATFEEDWSTHGMFAIDCLTGEDLSTPRWFDISTSYNISYEYQWQQYEVVGWTSVMTGYNKDGKPTYGDTPVYGWVTYNGSDTTFGSINEELLVDGTGVNLLGF
ncbi:MAG: Bacterial Ig-like domain (group 2) [Pelotomaculum sp. PtaU1.Bin065]|nr:MAG: Bacterial Ig-like domain (group 2) [Pelotomaculum sp. PtaU1.Bin065]